MELNNRLDHAQQRLVGRRLGVDTPVGAAVGDDPDGVGVVEPELDDTPSKLDELV
jgi:hypothetical protein